MNEDNSGFPSHIRCIMEHWINIPILNLNNRWYAYHGQKIIVLHTKQR